MKVSVVPEDGIIIIDGDVRKPAGVTWPEGVRAMQWSGNSGFIEYLERGQEYIDDIAVVQPFIDLHAAKKALDETPPPAPTGAEIALAEIRAIECAPAVADAMARASRLVALAYALDDLIRIAASKGQTVTRQQAHDWAMANDSNYKTLYDTEQVIKPLRALV